MDNTSFLADCLTECVSSYAGIDSYNKQEYVVKRIRKVIKDKRLFS